MTGIQRISSLFADQKAFVAYLTAGDGGIKKTLAAAFALIEGGVNILEIGVPFSDPIADGPVIQCASARALAAGTTLEDVFWLTTEIRKKSDVPLILFSYLNPLLAHFERSLFQKAKAAGIDGILLVDCPIEGSSFFREQCLMQDIAPIFVVSPSTPTARIQQLDAYGKGFLYYACRNGTTGVRNALPPDFAQKIRQIKSLTKLPVIVGFGIANAKIAKEVIMEADGAVVGSLFVQALHEGPSISQMTELARSINPLDIKK